MMKRWYGILGTIALAAPLASANVLPTMLQLGTQGPFTMFDDGARVNDSAWFVFTLNATTDINVDIDRLANDVDPLANLYAGDVTGVDFGNLRLNEIINNSDFGPLTFIDFEDDTDFDQPGPFGDPRFTRTLAPGTYSFVVGSFASSSALAPSGPFQITSNVPEPTALVLLSLGGLALLRRRNHS